MTARFRDSNDQNLWQFFDENGKLSGTVGIFNSLTLLTDDWNVVEIDYVLGSDTVTATLNGVEQTKTNISATRIELASIAWEHAGGSGIGSHFLVDNSIPEPATISLLALGGLMMLRRRRA